MNRIAPAIAVAGVSVVLASVVLAVTGHVMNRSPASVGGPAAPLPGQLPAGPPGTPSVWDLPPTGGPTTDPPTDLPASPTTEPPTAPAVSRTGPPAATPRGIDLTDPHKKDIAMQLVSSAENSSLNWRAQFSYIEDIGDGRGYTAGIVGFCSGTSDMVEVVQAYAKAKPGNILAKYLNALHAVDGTDSHSGLDPNFARDWRTAAADPAFQAAQESERDRVYFNPAVAQAKLDGLSALGQFIYYDAMVMHGPGNDPVSFGGIRKTAMSHARTPALGGNQTSYLNAFLDARKAAMLTEAAHDDTSRVDTEQRVFVGNGNLNLDTPLSWKTYGDSYRIAA